MDFISNQQPQIIEMLQAIGVRSIDDLFAVIPKSLRLPAPKEDDGLSEAEGMALIGSIANKNTFPSFTSYLGAGSYFHHVPALVNAITSKSEFLTSYTPYQAEASQGMLQVIFEFQSAICALTGMDVANASLYDGATACAEAVLMALRIKGYTGPGESHDAPSTNIVIARSLHPHYQRVVEQYLNTHRVHLRWIEYKEDLSLDIASAHKLIDKDTAAVLSAYPNFFGLIEDIKGLADYAKEKGALTIISANPLTYGLYASAKDIGADIAVGEAQPFGLHESFGGPFLGYIACRYELLRQLPGRIVGETKDSKGQRGFVLTLQAREQHIRRERATSNICTNQALAALAALVAILWYGKEGIKELALTNFQRCAYLRAELAKIPGIKVIGGTNHFNEFPVHFDKPLDHVFKCFRTNKIEPGIPLESFDKKLQGFLLIAVTEMKTKNDLDKYISVAKECQGDKL